MFDQLALAYLLHERLPHLVVLHIYPVGGESPGHHSAERPHHFVASLHGFLALPQRDEDGLAALAIHKEIGPLDAVQLSNAGQPLPRSADPLLYPARGGVGLCIGYYPGEHDPLTSILTPREERSLRRLNSYRHVRGIGHIHDATRRRLAHRPGATHRSAWKERPKRVCWIVIRYCSPHEKEIPNRPLRC